MNALDPNANFQRALDEVELGRASALSRSKMQEFHNLPQRIYS